MEIKQNFIRIQGKIIKVEPAHKTGYYLIIQEQETNQQKGVFSQWSYKLETDGLFTLRQSGRHFLITNYQALIKLNQIKSEEKNKVNSKLYQEQEAQEQKHEAKQISQLKAQIKQLEQDKQELINLTLNNNYIYSQLFSQQAQKVKSKPGKLSQVDKEQLENSNLALTQLQQERRELIIKLGKYSSIV